MVKPQQVYTYSIPGVFAQGAKHPLLDDLSFFIIIICWIFCAYTQILSRDMEDFCVHAQKFLIMNLDNRVFQHWIFAHIRKSLIETWEIFAYMRRNS